MKAMGIHGSGIASKSRRANLGSGVVDETSWFSNGEYFGSGKSCNARPLGVIKEASQNEPQLENLLAATASVAYGSKPINDSQFLH